MPDTWFGHHQHTGKRDYQEDTIGFQSSGEGGDATPELVVVADGMGGHVGGKAASDTAVRTFLDAYAVGDDTTTVPERLYAALLAANQALDVAIQKDPELDGMGCTLVAASSTAEGWHWISVGDSIVGKIEGGALYRLNEDHSMVGIFEELIAEGRMTREEADTDPRRSALRSALMGRDIEMIDQSDTPVTLGDSDTLFLASDGLDTLSEHEIIDVLSAKTSNAQDMAEGLVSAVLAHDTPAQDNVSVALLSRKTAQRSRTSLNAATLNRDPRRASTAAALPVSNRMIWAGGVGVVLALLAAIWFFALRSGPNVPEPRPDTPGEGDIETPPAIIEEPPSGEPLSETTPNADESRGSDEAGDDQTSGSGQPDSRDTQFDASGTVDPGLEPLAVPEIQQPPEQDQITPSESEPETP
ncbi:MAG: protein phosphatase 2C domain-containing protein [Pseudomonadota bacterium]